MNKKSSLLWKTIDDLQELSKRQLFALNYERYFKTLLDLRSILATSDILITKENNRYSEFINIKVHIFKWYEQRTNSLYEIASSNTEYPLKNLKNLELFTENIYAKKMYLSALEQQREIYAEKNPSNLEIKILELKDINTTISLQVEKFINDNKNNFIPIIVCDDIDSKIIYEIEESLAYVKHPIVIYPHNKVNTALLNASNLNNIIYVAIDNNLTTTAKTISVIKNTLFNEEKDNDINADIEDIFSVLKTNSLNQFYHSTAINCKNAVNNIIKSFNTKERIDGLLCIFHTHKDTPILEISEAMEALYRLDEEYPENEDIEIIFISRTDGININEAKIDLCKSIIHR